MLLLFKVVPEPGNKVSLPLYESTESCESLIQVEWQPGLSPQQNIFSLDYVCKLTSCAKQAWCHLASWLVSIVLCLGDQSICFTDFDDRDLSIEANLRGPQALNFPRCDPRPKSV